MKRIITAAILIPLVFVIIFVGQSQPWLITLAACVVAELASWEFLGLVDALGARTPRVYVLTAVALLFFTSYQFPGLEGPVMSALCLILFAVCALKGPVERTLLDSCGSVFCLVYIGYSLTTLPWLSARENGPSLLLLLFLVVWAGDTLALYVGRAWGKHRMAPSLSPGKTWEGAIASLVAGLVVTAGLLALASAFARRDFVWLSYPGSPVRWFILAAILNLAAQIGDLAESGLKRSVGVKDSGTMLPGHGGMLDRIDALLLAAPVLWYAQLAQQF